jgi:hypothetical protein
MQLGATDLGRASHSQMNLGARQHTDYRCGEIDPKIGPVSRPALLKLSCALDSYSCLRLGLPR